MMCVGRQLPLSALMLHQTLNTPTQQNHRHYHHHRRHHYHDEKAIEKNVNSITALNAARDEELQ